MLIPKKGIFGAGQDVELILKLWRRLGEMISPRSRRNFVT